MASEELIIRVNTDVNAKTKEQVEQTKQAFRFMGGAENQGNFEKIFKHSGNIERQIKSLTESVARGAPIQGMTNFISSFGRAGGVIGAAVVVAGATINHINKIAGKTMDLARAAKRAMVHPAELQEMRNVAERAGVSSESMDSMAQSYAQLLGQLKTNDPQYREQFFKNLTNPEDREKMRATLEQIIASEKPIGMNLAKEFAEGIRRHYTSVGNPEEGARIAEQWLQAWFGSIDMDRVKEDFKLVSEDAKKATDSLVEASQQWVVLTNTIMQNLNKMIRLVTLDIMNDPLVGPMLRGALKLSQIAVESAEHAFAQGEKPWWLPQVSDLLMLPNPALLGTTFLTRYLRGNTKLPEFTGIPGLDVAITNPAVGSAGGAAKPTSDEDTRPIPPLYLADLEKQIDNISELIVEFEKFNALLSPDERLSLQDLSSITRGALPPTNVQGNPAFHNSPQGGAVGESNPMQLPAGEPQPGGGAASEAVQSARDEKRSRMSVSMSEAMTYLNKNESKHAADLKDYMQTGGRNLTGDNNAWCARFVDAIQTRAGLPSLESSLPEGKRSGQKDDLTWSSLAYKDWGRGVAPSEDIREGDVFVKQRAGGGHVGTATGNYRLNAKTGEKEYEMLSGNIGGAAKGGGEVNLTYETIGGRGAGTTAGAGHGGVVAVRRGEKATVPDYSGPEEAVGKGKRLDPVGGGTDAQVAQRAIDDRLTGFNDDLPMSDEQRAKSERMRGERLPYSPISTNVEDRRRIDLSGDPGGLEGTGDQGPLDLSDLPGSRRTRMPLRQGPDLSEQLGMGELVRSELDRGRRSMDQDGGADLGGGESPSVKSRLNVNVKAPAGTEVRATADGDDNMFKGNVTTERQIPLQ